MTSKNVSLNDLREKRAKITHAMTKLGDQIVADKRDWTAEERLTFTQHAAARSRLDVEIVEAEADVEALRAEAVRQIDAGETTGPDGAVSPTTRLGGATGRRWASLHGDQRDTGGFKSLTDFVRTLHMNPTDQRIVSRASSGATDSDGGFLIPPAWSAALMDSALEQEIVRPRARVVALASRDQRFPAWDDDDHSTNLFNGFTASWATEGGTLSVQTPRIREIRLDAKKLALLTRVSAELLADAPTFEADLQAAMASATAFNLDHAFLRGDGVGKPLGCVNGDSTVTVSKETGQLADTLQVENLVKMYARLAPASQRNAVWIVSPSTIPELFTMGVAVGTGGVPIYMPTGGLPMPPPGTILGLPVLVSEKLPPVGDQGDVMLVDLSRYIIGMRADVRIDRSSHIYFTSDEVAFRLIVRVDAQPIADAAITPKGGGATLTWCAQLGERS